MVMTGDRRMMRMPCQQIRAIEHYNTIHILSNDTESYMMNLCYQSETEEE